MSSETGWVDQPEPGLTVEGQAVQAGDAAAQGTITSPAPGDTADQPDQIPADQATAYPPVTP